MIKIDCYVYFNIVLIFCVVFSCCIFFIINFWVLSGYFIEVSRNIEVKKINEIFVGI